MSTTCVTIIMLCLLVIPDLIMTTINFIEKKRKHYMRHELYLMELEAQIKAQEHQNQSPNKGEP